MSKPRSNILGDVATSVGTLLHLLSRYRELTEIVLLVLFWYCVNISLIISNKWLISETGYHSTSMLTLLHMMSSFVASSLLLGLGFVPNKQHMSPQLLAKVAVLAGSFTIAVASCMGSLAFLPASFVQALGSTTPAFTAVLAYLIQGRREADLTYAALMPVVVGIALASSGEPLFNSMGLVLQMVACSMRSLKTVLQSVLLTDERDRFHPMTLLAYTSAISTILLGILTAVTEPHSLAQAVALHHRNPSFTPLLLVGCTLAFLANFTNFLISKKLGALTLQVLGNFKNVLAAVAAVAVFNNPVTFLGLTGYGITSMGVFAYTNLVHKNPARWLSPPPVSRILGSAFTYRPATDAEADAVAGHGPGLGVSGLKSRTGSQGVLHLAVGAGVPAAIGNGGGVSSGGVHLVGSSPHTREDKAEAAQARALANGGGRSRGRDLREREWDRDGEEVVVPPGLGERAPLLSSVDRV